MDHDGRGSPAPPPCRKHWELHTCTPAEFRGGRKHRPRRQLVHCATAAADSIIGLFVLLRLASVICTCHPFALYALYISAHSYTDRASRSPPLSLYLSLGIEHSRTLPCMCDYICTYIATRGLRHWLDAGSGTCVPRGNPPEATQGKPRRCLVCCLSVQTYNIITATRTMCMCMCMCNLYIVRSICKNNPVSDFNWM